MHPKMRFLLENQVVENYRWKQGTGNHFQIVRECESSKYR